MKKRVSAILLALIIIFTVPGVAEAAKYSKSTGTKYIFTKEELTVYTDGYGSSTQGSIKRHRAAKVLDKNSSYVEIQYKKKGKKRTGWIDRSDYRDECMEYDGSEILYVTDGTYKLGGQEVVFKNLGGNLVYIYVKETEKYFTASTTGVMLLRAKKSKKDENQIWKLSRDNHHLMIRSESTGKYLVQSGGLLVLGTKKEAQNTTWSLIRSESNLNPYRDFLQYDGRWGNKKYGHSTTMCSSACGVVATVNMVYALTGQFSETMEVADYAVEKHYRIEYNGTDEGFSKAFGKGLGEQYGFKYAGEAPGVTAIKKCLQKGGVCVAHVPGHYVCIAAYNEKKDKYLVLDPHPLPKRKTSPFGSWVSRERLEAGYLNAYSSYKFERMTDEDCKFQWKIDEQDSAIIAKAIFHTQASKTEAKIKALISKGKK